MNSSSVADRILQALLEIASEKYGAEIKAIWKEWILMAETWVERHGAALGAVLTFGVMFLIFAWGMSM